MWETVTLSQLLSIVLGYLGTGNAYEDMKFINAVSPQSGIIVPETCWLLGRQTETEWILHNTIHSLFNIFFALAQYIVQY